MHRDYPPYAYLFNFSQHYASPVATYMTLWESRDHNCKVTLKKKQIPSDFLCTLAVFQDHCRKLVKEGLISIEDFPKSYVIELTDYDFDPDSAMIC